MKKTICVFTGTRAEYGLLKPLMDRINKDRDWNFQILVSGMHLSAEFGLTYKEIEKDGFKISEKVKILTNSDSIADISKSIGTGISGYSQALGRLRPDLIIILGDRFEALAAAIAALIARIPIVHIGGGEATYGLIDEAIRHSITKMSLLHFTSTEEYRQRVVQLGESPRRVFNVGAIGIDNILGMKLLTRPELERSLDFNLGEKSALVTFHPVTLEDNTAKYQVTELLKALDACRGLKIIFTKPNADPGGRIIIKLIDAYVRRSPNKAVAFSSLGQLRYLSCLKNVNLVIGNSSSGIIEAPSLKIPTVNIGDRQKGRIRAMSVIDVKPESGQISKAIQKALSPEFSKFCKTVSNPYGKGGTAEKIYRLIKRHISSLKDIKKTFYAIGEK
ncbi:MAG: UDP-N-acetylglucosamine 2-epimerase [Phycisphaerae bacterium]|jgi:GDP/UDP-N,N'-diacetylbacillosamine 2-epimerase (hydrolysing)